MYHTDMPCFRVCCFFFLVGYLHEVGCTRGKKKSKVEQITEGRKSFTFLLQAVEKEKNGLGVFCLERFSGVVFLVAKLQQQ
uniref:Hypothetical secreted protein 2073 n=1 Tax=Amblyomma variegatum TaxID=34610 RepID=F0JA16_AMBVA|nr:TPA_inf: hypothetical secreted protein 2073 [Amblyomma variegatum]